MFRLYIWNELILSHEEQEEMFAKQQTYRCQVTAIYNMIGASLFNRNSWKLSSDRRPLIIDILPCFLPISYLLVSFHVFPSEIRMIPFVYQISSRPLLIWLQTGWAKLGETSSVAWPHVHHTYPQQEQFCEKDSSNEVPKCSLDARWTWKRSPFHVLINGREVPIRFLSFQLYILIVLIIC